jgi:hypothetical protein
VIVIPVVLLTAVAVAVLLLTIDVTETSHQIDLVKTGLTVGAGTGGVVALVLAGRRQWATEQNARATEHDATERRVTELYTKAADQLGSEKAAVRLAGLYALERLGQNSHNQRETILNVICAYLRMPYTPPGAQPAANAPQEEHDRFDSRTQERQVRLTAQSILLRHRMYHTHDWWEVPPLDLSGANLAGADLTGARLSGIRLTGTHLAGADLTRANLTDADLSAADLTGAKLHGAILTNADLTGADQTDVDLTGVDLTGVTGLHAPRD